MTTLDLKLYGKLQRTPFNTLSICPPLQNFVEYKIFIIIIKQVMFLNSLYITICGFMFVSRQINCKFHIIIQKKKNTFTKYLYFSSLHNKVYKICCIY